jgi:hypothetical protein
LAEDVEFYQEKNNRSYKEHRLWANEAVQKLLVGKIVEKVSKEELVCINPLSVATNSRLKKRLCIDLSRKYNGLSEAKKFKIESTRHALQVIRRGDWMFSFDLKSAYLMIPVHPRFTRYLGFAVEEDDGSVTYYKYLMLPFGLNDAARVLTKVMKSPLDCWRRQGIVVFIHIDDGFVCMGSRGEAVRASEVVRSDLIRYGLLISEAKCSWGARRMLEWTGLVFDTVNFELTVPEWKMKKSMDAVVSLLDRRKVWVPTRELAGVAGLLGSLQLAMGEVTRFYTRSMLTQIVEVTDRFGWSGKLFLSERVVQELLFWRNNLESCNGRSMRVEDKVLQVQSADMYSDAGEHMMGGVQLEGEHIVQGSVFKQCFLEEDSRRSSTFRELRAIEEGIRIRGEQFRGHRVRWGCDNWAASKIITLGSMKPECHEVAKVIVGLARKFDIVLEPFWLSRSSKEIMVCDALSKDFDMSDYRLSSLDFGMLQGRFGPFSVDFFGSSFTARCRPFFTLVDCAGAAGVDAFSADWGTWGNGFFHPPVG